VAAEEGLYIATANPQAKPDNIYNVAIEEPTALAPEQESDARDLINSSSEESASTLHMALEPAPKDSKEQARLSFPIAQDPNISIIIPVFNNWSFTYNCLRSLSLYNRGSCEIIIVDNNSTDETPKLLAAVEGIQVLTNETNEVFVNACNQAAAVAKGNFLIFLNNDTEVSEGWLDAMLAPFADDSTGIVGAKLVYPDGSLQDAGGIIWSDGNGCNYGHGDNPDLPQYSYRKPVDYCSGACLMIRHTLWREIGGFDQRFAPAYYEDANLCFTVRSLAYKVTYQPPARIVHYGAPQPARTPVLDTNVIRTSIDLHLSKNGRKCSSAIMSSAPLVSTAPEREQATNTFSSSAGVRPRLRLVAHAQNAVDPARHGLQSVLLARSTRLRPQVHADFAGSWHRNLLRRSAV
jgi:GT2 family glycosyltransferase